MKKNIIRAEDRGRTIYKWLNGKHYFSFGDYYNPKRMGFGVLRVINDDIIAPSGGFDTHPHENMEIITIPLSGELRHRDSMGHESVLGPDEVQVMSAGTGITHSEYNSSNQEALKLFQIWIKPEVLDITPRYDQRHFFAEERNGKWQVLVSPDGQDGSIPINQQGYISRIEVIDNKNVVYTKRMKTSLVFILLISGSLDVEGELINERDAIQIDACNNENITFKSVIASDILVIEVSA